MKINEAKCEDCGVLTVLVRAKCIPCYTKVRDLLRRVERPAKEGYYMLTCIKCGDQTERSNYRTTAVCHNCRQIRKKEQAIKHYFKSRKVHTLKNNKTICGLKIDPVVNLSSEFRETTCRRCLTR